MAVSTSGSAGGPGNIVAILGHWLYHHVFFAQDAEYGQT
jgi:hypothetical protein